MKSLDSLKEMETNIEELHFLNTELPLETRVNDLVSRLTLDEKVNLMCQYQPAIPRLGIRAHKQGTEAAHGMAWLGEATSFPQPIGLACSWNSELMKDIGDVIGTEARAFYKRNPEVNGLTLWAPTVDMERDPRWGRTEEAYGEDPYLTGKLSAAIVKGIQGDHPFFFKAVATLKHFLANNNEVDRGSCSASIDPRNMHEYYLKPFECPFKEGGAYSMMTAYNSINGTPALLHPYVKEMVKEKWGMNGFIVSDAADLLGVVNDHGYYDDHAHSVAHAIKNGIDSMTDDFNTTTQAIRDALEKNLVSENDLEHALRNTFRVRFLLGEFDPEGHNPYASISESVICDPSHSELSARAARETVVMLKNEHNTLPLSKEKLRKVAVIGPLGDIVYRDWYSGNFPYEVTPFEGIKKKLQDKQVTFNSGNDKVMFKYKDQYIGFGSATDNQLLADKANREDAATFELSDWGWDNYTLRSLENGKYVTTSDDVHVSASADEVYGWFVKEAFHLLPVENNDVKLTTWNHQAIQLGEGNKLLVANSKDLSVSSSITKEVLENGVGKAVEAAKNSDVAIVFVGNNPVINGKEEIDRPDITLAESQERLIKEVYNVNPNTVVVVIGSYPFAINWVDENIPAVLYTSHAGQELGNAISDVLFGDYNPAGRLNMTWYRSIDQLPDLLDYDIIKGKRTYQYFDGEALYPFGHGQSYSEFKYEKLCLSSKEINENEEVTVTVMVRNKSDIPGDEVVQLYVHAKQSRFKRPLKQLIGFTRTYFRAGETKEIQFNVPAQELAVWDVTRDKYTVETGAYTLMVGQSSSNIKLTEDLFVHGEVIPPRNLYEVTRAENYDDYHDVFIDEGENGKYSVQSKNEGSWIKFSDVNLTEGVQSLEARILTKSTAPYIQIRVGSPDGEVIGTLQTKPSEAWSTKTCAIITEQIMENTDIYFVFTDSLSISHFRFIA